MTRPDFSAPTASPCPSVRLSRARTGHQARGLRGQSWLILCHGFHSDGVYRDDQRFGFRDCKAVILVMTGRRNAPRLNRLRTWACLISVIAGPCNHRLRSNLETIHRLRQSSTALRALCGDTSAVVGE